MKKSLCFSIYRRIKNKRFRKTIVIWSLVTFFLFLPIIYILSYCYILPKLESTIYVCYAYPFYQPIEYCRVHFDWFWKLTEYGYQSGNGKVPPLGRRNENSSSLRRDMYFYENGNLMTEVLGSYGYVRIRDFNEEGEIFTEGTESDGKKNGTFYSFVDNSVSTYKNGEILNTVWRGKNGETVGECSYRNGNPYDGEFYEFRIESFQTFVKGHLIKSEHYSIHNLNPYFGRLSGAD